MLQHESRQGSRALARLVAFRALAFCLALAVGVAMAQPRTGGTAPPFELPILDGDGTLRLADQRGKIVVLHFGASW